MRGGVATLNGITTRGTVGGTGTAGTLDLNGTSKTFTSLGNALSSF